jgi:Protein of unknown function (DUF1566)
LFREKGEGEMAMKKNLRSYQVVKWSLLILVVTPLIPVLLIAGTINLAQTGETTCYDTAGTLITCTGTGQDGDIQAGVRWPDPRFSDIGDETIRDNLTGLIWTQDAKIRCKSTAPNWPTALAYVAGMNSGVNTNFGYTDWRLPNALEMLSLSHQGAYYTGTWLESQGFTNVGTYASSYWTSTTWAKYPDKAWLFNLYSNFPWSGDKDAETYCFWPVRAGQQGTADPTYPANIWKTGQTTCYDNDGTIINCSNTGQDGEKQAGVPWPFIRFNDNADGTLTDHLTGLTWFSPNSILMTWQEALDYAITLSDPLTTYRLPNTTEAWSLQSFTVTPNMPSIGPSWTANSVNITNLSYERYAPIYDVNHANTTSPWAEQLKAQRVAMRFIVETIDMENITFGIDAALFILLLDEKK